MKVNTAPDFANMWGALDADTLSILEQNNLDDPQHERLPAVPLWVNGPKPNILLDCHHTHRIRERHRLKIRYVKLKFDDRLQAIEYAKRIQLGRRNLNESQRALLAVELAEKLRGRGGQKVESANLPIQNTLAKQANVSVRTIGDAKKVADKCDEKTKAAVRSGKLSISSAAKGPSFDPDKLEKQPARKATKPRNAKPTVSTKQRKDCLSLHAKFCRALAAVGIYDEFIVPLSQVAERLKQL